MESAPESPISAAVAALERAAFHDNARNVALDEAVHALAGTDLDAIERELSNFRERQRPVSNWLALLRRRISEVAP